MKNIKENTSAYPAEVKNEIIEPIDLLQEILLLLEEYFIGSFAVKENFIEMSFYNGQQFQLSCQNLAR